MKRWLIISLVFNAILIISISVFAFIYRDKIMQRFVQFKGNPAIIMYGNSITAQGKWTALLDRTDVLNGGLPGMTTYHFLQLLQTHVIDLHPKICFVKGGINDIIVGVSQAKMQGFYKAILDKLLASNIIPVVTLTVYEQNDPISKTEVDLLNQFLIKYCEEHRLTYIDLNRFISDSTGLKAEFAVDKTHLNEKAYEIWAREIKSVLKEKGI
ncbi:GDSL-type esterase/lipase family protein [Dyadobacter chenwenxiniae]|uniref:GDSL-type esterase/lipase family protein n=1 Tax=Dyadobacter chenwenxiniae TaxID=2906456 RepID=A0A9X1PIP2_9BACT|nr:GDSL-type esterase/lipase family protein [Dyadobacter chenwenxiniae]MCF0061553.1 GDSL-type esterase/lipase family protein [Dyadobacter chenwenxiniae]UON81377.1 GDSL-type esterase/lipase family protein [Dyadobacter chenwenxiniae]